MRSRTIRVLSTIVASIVSGLYWFAYWISMYGLTAGDYAPGYRPDPVFMRVKVGLVLVAGPAIFAVGIWIWRAMEARLTKTDSRN